MEISYTLNVTVNPLLRTSKLNVPSANKYLKIFKNFCSKTILNSEEVVFPLAKSFYIDVCESSIQNSYYETFENTLTDAWQTLYPGYYFL